MANTPNMKPELFEAIEGYFANEPEVVADILFYLSNLGRSKEKTFILSRDAEFKLATLGYCTKCGTKLELYTYKEYHDEVDDGHYEILSDLYCPVCDGPMNGDEDIDE